MMSLRIALIFVISFVLGLAVQAPANKLIPLLLPESAGFSLYEIDGRLVSGEAGYLQWSDQGLDDLRWDLHPAALFVGRISADISLSGGPSPVSKDDTWFAGEVSYAPLSQSLQLAQVKAALPVDALKPFLKTNYLPLQGNVLLNLAEADLNFEISAENALQQTAKGSLSLQDIVWKIGNPAPLGALSAQFETQDDGSLVLKVLEPGSEYLAVQGEASLAPDRSFKADIKLKPTDKTAKSVVNQMKALGRTDKQGWYSIKQSGKLPL